MATTNTSSVPADTTKDKGAKILHGILSKPSKAVSVSDVPSENTEKKRGLRRKLERNVNSVYAKRSLSDAKQESVTKKFKKTKKDKSFNSQTSKNTSSRSTSTSTRRHSSEKKNSDRQHWLGTKVTENNKTSKIPASSSTENKHEKSNNDGKFYYYFETQSSYLIEEKGTKLYGCEVCKGVYRYAFSLKRHFLRNHINVKYLSEADISNCMINVVQQDLIAKRHASGKRPKSNCAAAGSPRVSMQANFVSKSVSRSELYRCSLCSELFDYKEDLVEHTHNHMTAPPSVAPMAPVKAQLACEICGMKFTYKQNLIRHQAVHSGNLPFQCEYCERSFPTLISKKQHVRIHVHNKNKNKNISTITTTNSSSKNKTSNSNTTTAPTSTTTTTTSVAAVNTTTTTNTTATTTTTTTTTSSTTSNTTTTVKAATSTNNTKAMPNNSGSNNNDSTNSSNNNDSTNSSSNIIISSGGGSSCITASSSSHSIKSASVQSATSKTATKAEPESADDLQCQICGKVFSCSSFLMKHIVCMHNGAMKRKANQNRKAANNQKESTSQTVKQEPGVESQANASKENATARPSRQASRKKCKFRYICTVCKRKFRSYVQMCKHRRSAHSKAMVSDKNSAYYDIEQTDFENELLPGDFEAPYLEPKDVAENVARNLCYYIDGRVDSFSDFGKYVKVKGYTSLLEHDPEYLKQEFDAIWSEYNFPSSFKTENEVCVCTKKEGSPSLRPINSQECSLNTSVNNQNQSTCLSLGQLDSHSSNDPQENTKLTDNSSSCDPQTLTFDNPTTSIPVTKVVQNHFLSHCGLDLVNNAPSLHPANEGTANTENICDNTIHPPLSSASVPCLDSCCNPAVCSGFLATSDVSQNPDPLNTTSVPSLNPPSFSCSSEQPEPSPSKEDTEKHTVSSGDISSEGGVNNCAGVQETQEFGLDSVPKQVHFQSASVVHKYSTYPKTFCHTAASKQDAMNPDLLKTCSVNSNEIYATVLPKTEGPFLQSTSKNDDKKQNGLQQQLCLHNCSQSSSLLTNSEVGKVPTLTPAPDSETSKVNRVLKCGQKDVLFSGPHMMTAHIHERGHLVLEFGNEDEISSKIKNSSNVRHEEPQKAFSLKSSSSVKKSKKNQNLLDFSIQHIVKSRVEDYKKFMVENHMWPVEVSSTNQVENGENKYSNLINYPQYDIPTRLGKVINKNNSDSEKISTFIKSGLLPCENLKDLENCFRGVCFQSWNCEVLNYDKIAFGKQGIVNLICSVCHKHFLDLDSLLRHQLHRHPSIECNFLEVELGQSIVALHYPTPNIQGVLCSPNIDLSASKTLETYKCSKCQNSFPTVSRLHSHIIRCASNLDNTLNASNSKIGKRKYKKRLKKRLRDVLNGSNTFKFRLKDFAGYDPTMFRESHVTRSRLTDGGENSRVAYIEDDPDRTRKRRGHDLSYDPRNHVRRRESVEVVETHQCRGCNIKFKSLLSLEKHAPNCSHKDKLQNLRLLEGTTAPTPPAKSKPQYRCHYCNKQFTYPKSLSNHYINFCSARNRRKKFGSLSANDLQKEAAIASLVEQEENEKLPEISIPAEKNSEEQSSNCKGLKRKFCKKNYSWTWIKKKRNQNSEKAGANVENDDEDEVEEEEEGEDALEYDNDAAAEEKEDQLAFNREDKNKPSSYNNSEIPGTNVCRTKAKSSDACLEELLVEKKPFLQLKTIEENSQNSLTKQQVRNSNVVEKASTHTNSGVKLSPNNVACKTEMSCERRGVYKNILESELYKQLTKETLFVSATGSLHANVKQEPRDMELTKASVADTQPSVFEDQLNQDTAKSEIQFDDGTDKLASTLNIGADRSEVAQEIQTSTICDREEVKPNSLVMQPPVEIANKTFEDGQDVKPPENNAGDTDNQHSSLPGESSEEADKKFGDISSRASQCHVVSDSLPKDTTAGVSDITSESHPTDAAGTPDTSYVLMSDGFLPGQSTDRNNEEMLNLCGSTNVVAAEKDTNIENLQTDSAKEGVPLLQLCTDGSTVVLWPVGMGGLPKEFKPVVDRTLGVTIPGLELNLTNSSDSVSSTSICEKTPTGNSMFCGIEPLHEEVESSATSNEPNVTLISGDQTKTQEKSCIERPSETIKYLLTHPAGQDVESCQFPTARNKFVTQDTDASKIQFVREPAVSSPANKLCSTEVTTLTTQTSEKHVMRNILNKPPLAEPTITMDMLRNSSLAGPVINAPLIPIPSGNSERSVPTSCECSPVLNRASSTNYEVSCTSENINPKTRLSNPDTVVDTTTNCKLKESSFDCNKEIPLLRATPISKLAADSFVVMNSTSKELGSTSSSAGTTFELNNFSKEMQFTECNTKCDEAISCPAASPSSLSDTFVSTTDDDCHSNVLIDHQEPDSVVVSVTSESLENVSKHDSETVTEDSACEVTSLSADVSGSETRTLTANNCEVNTSANEGFTEECIVDKNSIVEEITDGANTMLTEEHFSGTELAVLNEPITTISKDQVQEDGPHLTYTDNITEESGTQETVSEQSQMDVSSLNVVYTPLPEFCEVNVTLVASASYNIGENEPSIVSVVNDVPVNETVTTNVSVIRDESKSEMVAVPVVDSGSEIETLEGVESKPGNGMRDSVDSEPDQTVETSSTVDSEHENETMDTASFVDSNSENETVHAAQVGDSVSDTEMVETASTEEDEPENEAIVTESIIDMKPECETEEVSVEVDSPGDEIVTIVGSEIGDVPVNETLEVLSVVDNLYEKETIESLPVTGSAYRNETTAQAVLVDLSTNEIAVETESAVDVSSDSEMVTNVSPAMEDSTVDGQVTAPGLLVLSNTLENEAAVVEMAVGSEGEGGGEEEEETTTISIPMEGCPEPGTETGPVILRRSSEWENVVQMAKSVTDSSNISTTGDLSESETGVNVLTTDNTLRNEMAAVVCEIDEEDEEETASGIASVIDGGVVGFEDKTWSDTSVRSCLRVNENNEVPTGCTAMMENSTRMSCSVFGDNLVPAVTEADKVFNIVVTLSDVSSEGSPQTGITTLSKTCVTLPNPDHVSLLNNTIVAPPQIKTVASAMISSGSNDDESISVKSAHVQQEETAAFVVIEGAANTSSLLSGCGAAEDKTTVHCVVSNSDIHEVPELSTGSIVIRDLPDKESTSVSTIYDPSAEKNLDPEVNSTCSGKVTIAVSSVYSTALLNEIAASLPVTCSSVCGKAITSVPLVCNVAPGKEMANVSVIDGSISGKQIAAVPVGCGNVLANERTMASEEYGSATILASDSHVAEKIMSLPVACTGLPRNVLLAPQPSVLITSGTATITTSTCSRMASLTCNRVLQNTAPFVSSTGGRGVHRPLTCNDEVQTSASFTPTVMCVGVLPDKTAQCSSSVVTEPMDYSPLTGGTIESEQRLLPETLRNNCMISVHQTCGSDVPEETAHVPLTCSDVVSEKTTHTPPTCSSVVPEEATHIPQTCSSVVLEETELTPQTCRDLVQEEAESTQLTCSNVVPEEAAPIPLTCDNVVQEKEESTPLTCSSAVPGGTLPTLTCSSIVPGEITFTPLTCSEIVPGETVPRLLTCGSKPEETAPTPLTCNSAIPEEAAATLLTCSDVVPMESKRTPLTCGRFSGLDILALSVTNQFVPETESLASLAGDSISPRADTKSNSFVSPGSGTPIRNPHTENLQSVLSKCYDSTSNTNKSNRYLDKLATRSESLGSLNAAVVNKNLAKCIDSSEDNFRKLLKNSSFDYLTHSTDVDSGTVECWKYGVSVPENVPKDSEIESDKRQLRDLCTSTKHLGDPECVKSLGENARVLLEEQELDSDSDPLLVLSRVAVAKISESPMKSEENLKKEDDYSTITTLNFESELELEVVPEAIMEGDILYEDFPSTIVVHTSVCPDSNATLETPPDCRKMMQYITDIPRTFKPSLPSLSAPFPLVGGLPHRSKSQTPSSTHCLAFDNFEDATQAKHIKVTDSILQTDPASDPNSAPKPGPSLNPSPN